MNGGNNMKTQNQYKNGETKLHFFLSRYKELNDATQNLFQS